MRTPCDPPISRASVVACAVGSRATRIFRSAVGPGSAKLRRDRAGADRPLVASLLLHDVRTTALSPISAVRAAIATNKRRLSGSPIGTPNGCCGGAIRTCHLPRSGWFNLNSAFDRALEPGGACSAISERISIPCL